MPADIVWSSLVLVGALLPAPALASPSEPTWPVARPAGPRMLKLTVPGSTQATHLGRVALSDDLLAVGAPGFRTFAGAVFLFDRATGQQVGAITRPGARSGDWFGSALAFDGHALIVGAHHSGAVGYAARLDLGTGAELVRYEPASPVPGSYFGTTVVVDGDLVAVGAPGTFPFPPDEGQVHLFDHATGTPLGAIASPDPTSIFGPTHFFGASLAAEHGLLAVGAPGTDNVGTAFVYDLTTASMLFRLEPPPGYPSGAFGSAVAMAGGRVAVGDPVTDGALGAVHVYDVAGGTHLYTVTNAAGTPGTGFGLSVALDRSRLAVGNRHAELGLAHGVVTVYDAVTGALLDTLTGFPAPVTHTFGSSLDLHRGVLAVGDEQDSEVAIYAGAAYLVACP
jgi:hypothetical protein